MTEWNEGDKVQWENGSGLRYTGTVKGRSVRDGNYNILQDIGTRSVEIRGIPGRMLEKLTIHPFLSQVEAYKDREQRILCDLERLWQTWHNNASGDGKYMTDVTKEHLRRHILDEFRPKGFREIGRIIITPDKASGYYGVDLDLGLLACTEIIRLHISYDKASVETIYPYGKPPFLKNISAKVKRVLDWYDGPILVEAEDAEGKKYLGWALKENSFGVVCVHDEMEAYNQFLKGNADLRDTILAGGDSVDWWTACKIEPDGSLDLLWEQESIVNASDSLPLKGYRI